jgi:hypothetical protein
MKTQSRTKRMMITAFLLFFTAALSQMNRGAEVLVGDDFQYRPNAADLQGTWRTAGRGGRKLILSGVLNTNIEMGGLPAQDLHKIAGPSKKGFTIRRDAGTFFFEGRIAKSGKGSGRFCFRPAAGYAEKIKELRSPGANKGSVTAEPSLFYCAVHNLSYDYARRIRDAGDKEISLNDLLRLCSTGVAPEYIKTMADIGYKDLSADDLILLTVQKVPTDFIKTVIGTSDNLPTARELTLIWMYGEKVSKFKHHKN